MYIRQKTATDCGIATLANALNISYEKALQSYSPAHAKTGVTIQETCAVLHAHGYLPIYLPMPGFRTISNIPNCQTATPFELKNTPLHQAPAILQVLSNGVVHQVFFDGKHIIDPSPSASNPRQLSDYEALIDLVFVLKPTQFFVSKAKQWVVVKARWLCAKISQWRQGARSFVSKGVLLSSKAWRFVLKKMGKLAL